MKLQEFLRAANGYVKTKLATTKTSGNIPFMKHVFSISFYSLGILRTLHMCVFQKAGIYL